MLEDRPDIVVLVPYAAYPAAMGGRRSIAAFNEMLTRHYEVHIVTTGNSAPPPGGMHLHPVLGSSRWRYANPTLFKTIKKLMASVGTEKLVLIQPYFGWLALLLKHVAGKVYYVKSENVEACRFKDLGRWWWPLMQLYEGITLRGARGVFFITGEDRLKAIKQYKLRFHRCHVFPYGTTRIAAPAADERKQARAVLSQRFGIEEDERILLFNGTLNYLPNLHALQVILNDLLPVWLQEDRRFRLIICGSNLPEGYKNLADYKDKKVNYAGFVNDIDNYFLGSDVFLNPVWEGGGIKTKLVDALASGCTAVSTYSGSLGIPMHVAGKKLVLVEDKDWPVFAARVMEVNTDDITPGDFYNYFNYDANISRVAAIIQSDKSDDSWH